MFQANLEECWPCSYTDLTNGGEAWYPFAFLENMSLFSLIVTIRLMGMAILSALLEISTCTSLMPPNISCFDAEHYNATHLQRSIQGSILLPG